MKKMRLILLISTVLISLIVTNLYLLSNNSLKNNDDWLSSKLNLEMSVMSASNFFEDTQALNQNQLNLGAWHGFQEVYTKNMFDFDQIDLDLKLQKNAYLIIHYYTDFDKKESIRLSNHSQFPTSCLVISQSGEFTRNQSFPKKIINHDQWIHIKMLIGKSSIKIIINDKTLYCPISELKISQVGLKGGFNKSFVDNILLKKNNQVIFKEDFSNTRSKSRIFFLSFVTLSLFQLIIIKGFEKKIKQKLFSFILISLSSSILLSLLIVYLYFLIFFIGNYPNMHSIISNLSKNETQWTDNEIDKIDNQVISQFTDNEHEKIIFIGSSQTWGAGASKQKNTFPALFEKLINEKTMDNKQKNIPHKVRGQQTNKILGISTDNQMVIVNTGISGSTSSQLLKKYSDEWINLEPKVVFINLSSNDSTYGIPEKEFVANLEKFISINKSKNIRTIFLVEPQSIEIERENPFHEVVKSLGKKHNILVINLHSYLEDKNDSGLIWWDFIHPTDYGHELIAKFILDSIHQE